MPGVFFDLSQQSRSLNGNTHTRVWGSDIVQNDAAQQVRMIHPSHSLEARTALRATAALALVLLLVIILPAPELTRGLANYLPLHTALEVGAISVAVLIFAIGWNTHRHLDSTGVIWLACLFFGVALLDLSHTLSYTGMPAFITPSGPDKAINFWLAARALATVALLVMAFTPHDWRGARRSRGLIAVLAVVIALHVLFLHFPQLVPRTFIPGWGLTPFKIGFEYVLIALCLLAAARFALQLTQPRRRHASGLFVAAMAMAMSEALFTLYTDVTDLYNLTGHLYKVVAYAYLYRALFVENVQRPYVELHASRQQLQATLDALPDLLFEMDEQGRYLSVHARDPQQLVGEAAQLIGRSVHDVVPPDAADTVMRAIEDAALVGHSHGQRLKLVTNKAERHFELSLSRLTRDQDEASHYLVLSREVTRIVEQEQQLEHEARLNDALLRISEESARSDEDALLAHAAEHAVAMTGSRLAAVFMISEDSRSMQLRTPRPPQGEHPPCLLAEAGMAAETLFDGHPRVLRQDELDALPPCLREAWTVSERAVLVSVRDEFRPRLLLCVADKSTVTISSRCWPVPRRRCIASSRRGATASASSRRKCSSTPRARWHWPPPCTAHSNAANCTWCTSRSCACAATVSSAPRPCCAGAARNGAKSRRPNSSPSRKPMARSWRSATGCCTPPPVTCNAGATTASTA